MSIADLTRDDAIALDRSDPIAFARDRFVLPEGVIYLDGNSLGARPRGVVERAAEVMTRQWGGDLIASWNVHGWMDLPCRVGDRIGELIGAAPGQVVAVDTTSVNIFKALHGALSLRPGRSVIVTEAQNFPTDRYLIESVAASRGCAVRFADPPALEASIDDDTALVCLTHVNYRTGAMHDLAAVTVAAHRAGALMMWDLAHSVGAVPVALDAADVDVAVGCSYKFLNGGPGAPAFVYVSARLQDQIVQPVTGWLGHVAPFAMRPDYEPAPGIVRFVAGTPPVVALASLDAALDAFEGVSTEALRAKSVALSALFIDGVEQRCAGLGLTLASPRSPHERGSQVCFAHEYGYGVIQALIARKVIGDYREPSICRFGLAPLYLRYVDVWDAVEHLACLLEAGEHLDPRHDDRHAVT